MNFVLVREPLSLGRMALGFVYFVFLPSVVTTPLAGRAVQRFGARPTVWASLALAALGLPLLLVPGLPAVIFGLTLIGVGTFFAQAAATGFVGRAATADRGSASGIYLACYFSGGLVGSAVLGQVFDHLWLGGLRRRYRPVSDGRSHTGCPSQAAPLSSHLNDSFCHLAFSCNSAPTR